MKAAAALVASVLTAIGGGGATTTPATISTCVDISKVLQVGSRSGDVVKLQQFLKVSPTGYLGPVTRAALIKWQVSKGIIKSGKTLGAGTTGPKTRAALACAPAVGKLIVQPLPPIPPPPALQNPPPPAAVPTPPPAAAISGGGSRSGGIAPGCPSFTTAKPSTQCEWEWQKMIDESGCYIDWDCSDPNPGG